VDLTPRHPATARRSCARHLRRGGARWTLRALNLRHSRDRKQTRACGVVRLLDTRTMKSFPAALAFLGLDPKEPRFRATLGQGGTPALRKDPSRTSANSTPSQYITILRQWRSVRSASGYSGDVVQARKTGRREGTPSTSWRLFFSRVPKDMAIECPVDTCLGIPRRSASIRECLRLHPITCCARAVIADITNAVSPTPTRKFAGERRLVKPRP